MSPLKLPFDRGRETGKIDAGMGDGFTLGLLTSTGAGGVRF
jgi:hypothetical protein